MPRSARGFTLIELLVVISIIAILSAVGLVSYQNIRTNAQNAKIKADLIAIKKAYETKFDPSANGGQGGYKPLSPANFADGKIPVQPNGSPYPITVPSPNPDGTVSGFIICPTGSIDSRCSKADQGSWTGAVTLSSCDTYNVLSSSQAALSGYWKFDGDATSTIPGTNGTAVGSPTYPAGLLSNAVNLNGSSQYITMPSPGTTGFSWNNFSVSLWVKPALSDIPGGGGAMVWSYGRNYRNYQIYITERQGRPSSWMVGSNFTPGNVGNNRILSSSPVNITSFAHLVLTRNGADNKFYLNGVLVGSDTLGVPADISTGPDSAWHAIGRGISGNFFQGMVDDVRFYNNKILSQTEVNALYNNGNGCAP